MGSSLSLFRANVGALNVLLGALFSFPVDLSLSLCFSGHVICSLAVLLFLLLTPLRTLTSCRPHVDLWPTSVFFFFLRLVVHFLYFCALENPTFLSVRSVTNTPHTDCVLSTHWDGGGDPRSLSLAVSVCDHHPILSPFFPCPPACLHVHEADFHRSTPPCVCMETLGWGIGVTGLLMMTQILHWHIMLLGQQTYVFEWHAYWMTLQSVSVPPQWYVPWGVKKATTLFGEIWLVFAQFMYECCGCFVCHRCVNCVHLMGYIVWNIYVFVIVLRVNVILFLPLM